MNITNTKNSGELTISLEGRLDTVTAPQLDTFINDNIEGVNKIIIDMEKLEYVSSAGLRVLLAAQKRMKAKENMILKNVCEIVMEVFEMTGFADILNIQ